MSRRGQSITLSISDRDRKQLVQIAREQGMLWGDRPNISRLVEAIARRELLLGGNNDWSETRIRALQQSMQALTDAGHPDAAEVIAQLLLERSELPIPLRSSIEHYLETPLAPWRLEIDRYINRQQPFLLTYRDAVDRPWTFTIRYARITAYERRQYLECWCEETAGNQDLPQLQHNWTLRLDRISDAALSDVQGKWRNLDVVEVQMHLLDRLAFAYEPKPEDIANQWLPDYTPPIRQIIRKVSSTFWFFRELRQYGEDCLIIAPEVVRERFKAQLQAWCEQYNMNAGEHPVT